MVDRGNRRYYQTHTVAQMREFVDIARDRDYDDTPMYTAEDWEWEIEKRNERFREYASGFVGVSGPFVRRFI